MRKPIVIPSCYCPLKQSITITPLIEIIVLFLLPVETQAWASMEE